MWTDEPVTSVADNFEILTSNSFLDFSNKNEDVESLLRSASPSRQRSLSLRDRPPSGRAYLKSFSRSPSPSKIKEITSSMSTMRSSNKWQENWKNALEKAVDDPEVPHRIPANSDDVVSMLDSNRGGDWLPMKANHDLAFTSDDLGIYKSRKPYVFEDTNSAAPTRLSRSHSMSTLNKSMNSASFLTGQSYNKGPKAPEKSVLELHDTLEESENRRNILIHKLKEAQTTLELQSERLSKIESSAKDNSLLVEDLKTKEKAYRKKIQHLEAGQEEKQRLKMENLRLREEMQARISSLDNQLKQLKTQHNSNENENDKRVHLLNHTTTILSLLEEENAKLHQDKEKLLSELNLTKEALDLIKANYSSVEMDHYNLKNECSRLKEDNTLLARKVQEMAGQMVELRSLLQAVRDENERISSTWRTTTEDKAQTAKQVEGYRDMISDLKSRLSATIADRDRLFQEKLEMNSKIQQMVLDKEQLMRAKLNLEDQVNNHYSCNSYMKPSDYRQDFEKTELTKEHAAVKKTCDELTNELSSVKLYYERSLEQISSLEKSRALLQSQLDIGDHEKTRLQLELDRLMQLQRERNMDETSDRDFQDEQIYQLRNELKKMRFERIEMEAKIQDLNAKLVKANEGLREETVFQNTELDMWKSTCERTTLSLAQKESELQSITDRCHQLEDTILGLRKDLRAHKDANTMSTKFDDSERLKLENKRLLQEKNENEQLIKLLETQKSVLTKSLEEGITRTRELDNLKEQVNQLRNENEILRTKKTDFEKQLENSQETIKSNSREGVDEKTEEVERANKKLREQNNELMHKLDAVNQENTRIKQALSKTESESLKEENSKLMKEIESLRQESQSLHGQHQNLDGNKESPELIKLKKEKDAVHKQVTLLQGQLNLVEGSKKRAEDQVSRLNTELNEMRVKMNQINNSQHPPLEAELRKEVEILKQKLEKSGEERLLLESGFNTEQQEVKKKMKELVSELDQKKRLVESLETQVKLSDSKAESREQDFKSLTNAVKERESENQKLKKEIQEKKNTLTIAPKLSQEKLSSKIADTRLSIQEELADVLKAKQNGMESPRSGPFRSKSLNTADLKSPASPSEAVPDKAATEGSTRLQSLISKYRNHSDTEEGGQPNAKKPGPPKIVYKSKFGVSTASTPLSETQSVSEAPSTSADLAPTNSSPPTDSLGTRGVRPAKKLPPEPLPKPASPMWTKSTFMRSMSGDNASKGSDHKLATPATLRSSFHATTSLTAQQSTGSSGLGHSLGDSDDLNDSQEQKDINALIQK